MLRRILFTSAFALICMMSGSPAHAQYGMGWGGWGGWGATSFPGDVARGAGYFAMGAGIYNEQTAVANSINADTLMRLNNYWYNSYLESMRMYHETKAFNIQKNKVSYEKIMDRLNNHPTARDVENGDALNAVLSELSDPRVSSSALKSSKPMIPAQDIREIPFKNNSEMVTIVLSDIKKASKWPTVLDNDRFAEERKTFEEVVDQARQEDEVGEISPQTMSRCNALVDHLRAKLEKQPLAEFRDQQEAQKWVKTLAGLVRMLGMPDTKDAFDELKKVKSTSVGSLLAFMQSFNLRFGPATSPREKMLYNRLYPVLDETRDRIREALGTRPDTTTTARANPSDVIEAFSKLPDDQLRGKKGAPEPPKPNQ
ncbi:MAG: hypothetical protein ACLQIB_31655 [Isosphaeraceae bacterium]